MEPYRDQSAFVNTKFGKVLWNWRYVNKNILSPFYH